MPAISSQAAIRVLPADVVSRIAAGEVIERPAAVVKELIENSLDAGSRRVTVDVKEGGSALIRVTDDGDGIRRTDLPLAFERHATSKLQSDDDLVSIRTMGFRGEALPSIASVARIQVTTATRQEALGATLSLVAGVPQEIADAPPVPGTSIEVADLFFNQPARKKFLKSVATEFSHISHVVQQASLAWPTVHFRLTHNGNEILNFPAVDSDRDRILQVYRPAFLDKSVELRGRIAGCSLRGVVVDPIHARSSKVPQDLFVNRRPVKNTAVFHAVTDGYASFLAKGTQPTFVLFLDIDPDRIDVNVHPAKREIRFADQETVHQFVRHTLRHAFSGLERKLVLGTDSAKDETVGMAPMSVAPVPMGCTGQSSSALQAANSGAFRGAGANPSFEVAQGAPPLFTAEATAAYGAPSAVDVTAFGQILRTYLVAQVGQELQVIDQHTAHERVQFQRLMRRWKSREIASQPLLIPEPVELTATQSALLQKHFGELEQLGLHLEIFGTSAVAMRAIPVGLGPLNASLLLQDLLEDISEWHSTSSFDAKAQSVLATMACKSAVQAGRSMTLPEIEQLIRDWVDEGLVMTCPHGRRTAFRLSADELDKLFGRVGWA